MKEMNNGNTGLALTKYDVDCIIKLQQAIRNGEGIKNAKINAYKLFREIAGCLPIKRYSTEEEQQAFVLAYKKAAAKLQQPVFCYYNIECDNAEQKIIDAIEGAFKKESESLRSFESPIEKKEREKKDKVRRELQMAKSAVSTAKSFVTSAKKRIEGARNSLLNASDEKEKKKYAKKLETELSSLKENNEKLEKKTQELQRLQAQAVALGIVGE